MNSSFSSYVIQASMFNTTSFTITYLMLFIAIEASVIPYGWEIPWGSFWEPLHYNQRYGSGANVGFNKGFDDERAALSARGSNNEWGNYNYREHGDYARGTSSGDDVAYGTSNAYNNGWGNGWRWGARRLQLPWGWNDQVPPRYWWTD